MQRRELLKALAATPILLALPRLAFAASQEPRFLVLLELNGGNDGLNMVIPYADAAYRKLRPNIGIERDQVLQLDEHVGLHPAMTSLMEPFNAKELGVVLGLGYPNPSRSHFRSIEIWDTATDASVTSNDGWLSHLGSGPFAQYKLAADAVVIGRNPRPAEGGSLQTLVMGDPARFAKDAAALQAVDGAGSSAALRHIIAMNQQIAGSATALIAESRPKPPGKFPNSKLGKDLAYSARLLMGQPAAAIVKVSLTGFDTHRTQPALQERLLRELSEALAAFRGSMKEAGLWDRTLVMTYSEFGRRAAENGSKGTDHGTAAPHLVFGGAVKGGIHGRQPSLTDLENGDLKHAVDFRSYYNTVLSRWWGRQSNLFEVSKHPVIDFV